MIPPRARPFLPGPRAAGSAGSRRHHPMEPQLFSWVSGPSARPGGRHLLLPGRREGGGAAARPPGMLRRSAAGPGERGRAVPAPQGNDAAVHLVCAAGLRAVEGASLTLLSPIFSAKPWVVPGPGLVPAGRLEWCWRWDTRVWLSGLSAPRVLPHLVATCLVLKA